MELIVLNSIYGLDYPTGIAFTPVPSALGGRFFPFFDPRTFVGAPSSSSGIDHVRFFKGI